MQLHSLYFLQLGDFCDDMCSLSVDVEGLGGSRSVETTLQKRQTRDLMQVLGTIKMSTSNHRQHPNTFHFCPGCLTFALIQICIT